MVMDVMVHTNIFTEDLIMGITERKYLFLKMVDNDVSVVSIIQYSNNRTLQIIGHVDTWLAENF